MTAALAALLLLLAPAGHAQAAGTQDKAVAQTVVAHDAVVVAPTTRPAAGRTGGVSLPGVVATPESKSDQEPDPRPATHQEPATQPDSDTAPARAPPLEG